MEHQKNYEELQSELAELRYQLEEANDMLDAIRTGKVDALVVKDENGHQLYSLKSADHSYRVFIEKMNEGAVTLNSDGIIIYSNWRFAAAVAMPLEKVVGVNFANFVPEYGKSLFQHLLKEAWTKDVKTEFYLLNSKGTEVPFLLSLTTLELDEGPAMSIILTDLTQQKEVEEHLKENNLKLQQAQDYMTSLNQVLEEKVAARTQELLLSREHFRLLADNLPQITWTNAPTGAVDFFNLRWFNYTGLSPEESKEWAWQKVVHPDDLNITMSKYFESLNTGTIYEVETRLRDADGRYRWHLNRSMPLKNDKGNILFWVGTATDIEEHKRAIEKKDEFIGIASHELKTPLTSLKGYLQLIESYRNQDVPPVVKQFVYKANGAIGKLQTLVDDLLNVSKIQAGKLQFEISVINLSELLNTWVENANHIHPSFIIKNTTTDIYFVYGNAERLEQVLMNLISNAVKYGGNSKEIFVEAKKLDGHVEVSVRDKGIGLSRIQIERIFERFYRVDDKNFTASGLGMGLYICSEIIKSHHGTMRVESTPGNGSVFYFTVPFYSEEQVDQTA